jgi:hypothetical protein
MIAPPWVLLVAQPQDNRDEIAIASRFAAQG